MQYGHELAVFREKKFWSQETLANELGVTRATIWRWEKSNKLPNTALLRLRKWTKLKAMDPDARLERNIVTGRPSLERFSNG